jgi:uncharacterized membrane protein
MSEERRINYPLAIHIACVIPATVIGTSILLNKKGTPIHRYTGRVWVGLMTTGNNYVDSQLDP